MKQLHQKWHLLVLGASVTLTLGACSGPGDDLNRYIAEVHARPAGPIEPIPPVKTYTPYDYQGIVARDPFIASTSEGNEPEQTASNATGPRPDFDRPREYLERFELDTLEMVGTFARGENEWALVRDPDNVVHRVAVEDYMGKNHGKVTSIQPDTVELVELVSDGAGGWLLREVSIALD